MNDTTEARARIEAGGVTFAMRYRDDIAGDGGLCIEVRGEVDGDDTELLRFDCFRVAPHYHYGPQADDERLMLDLTAAGDALEWTLNCFERGRLRPMLARAGYQSVADALNEAQIAALMPAITGAAQAIVAARDVLPNPSAT